ncbi:MULTISPECIES: hypothetical protein [unclassified Microbacterium]|uniref:hypothetical protein n=1 Tax=unclassified Microbacterium TaxID=2609290 RepID=UPI00386E8B1A
MTIGTAEGATNGKAGATTRYQLYRDGQPAEGFTTAPNREWAERDKASQVDADRDLNRGKHKYTIRKVTP